MMRSLPPTDIEFGSMVSLGYPVNGMRDPILYQQALLPKLYVMKVPVNQRPEPRWMVDPDDYLRPMVYDPDDARGAKPRPDRDHGDDD